METLGDRIKSARLIQAMSQAELAEKVGVSRAAVSQWESGETKGLKPENLLAVAKALKVNLNWLVYGQGSMEETCEYPPEHKGLSRNARRFLRRFTDAAAKGALSSSEIELLQRMLDHLAKDEVKQKAMVGEPYDDTTNT